MSIKLGLRGDQHLVTVVTPNDSTRAVLGTREPQDHDDTARRAKALAQWGRASHLQPKQTAQTIDVPLSQRSQTILSHELPPELARRLNQQG
jgi:hypothetical protein